MKMDMWYKLVLLLSLYTCSTHESFVPKCSVLNINGTLVAAIYSLNCKDKLTDPPAPNAVPAPVNFTVATLPSTLPGYRDLKYQWKFPQDGSAANVTSFMMLGGEIGQQNYGCRTYTIYKLYKPKEQILESTVVCTKRVKVEANPRQVQHVWYKLYSIPRSSSPATFNHTITYYPDINVRVDHCAGTVEAWFDDYMYHSYNMAIEYGWTDQNRTLVCPIERLPADHTKHTFFNISEGRYKIVLIPYKCSNCLRTVQKFEIDKSHCLTTTQKTATSTSMKPSTTTATPKIDVVIVNSSNITKQLPISAQTTTPKDLLVSNSQTTLGWVLGSLGIVVVLIVLVSFLYIYRRNSSKRRYSDTPLPRYVNPLVSSNDFIHVKELSDGDLKLGALSKRGNRRNVLILSTWDKDSSVCNFYRLLQQCSCDVSLSVYDNKRFNPTPESWLDEKMPEADTVVLIHTKLSCDLLTEKASKDQFQHEDLSIDLFLTAIEMIKLNKGSDEIKKYVNVVWGNMDVNFDLSDVTGGLFHLPDQLDDLLRHIHHVKPMDALSDLIYKPGSKEESTWLKSLPVPSDRLESGYQSDRSYDYGIGYSVSEVGHPVNTKNMTAIEDLSDLGTVLTRFKSPAPSTFISPSEISDGAPDNVRRVSADRNKNSLAIEDFSDVGSVGTELYPPSGLMNPSIVTNNYHTSRQNRFDQTDAGFHTRPPKLHNSASIDSYTSAESISLSQGSNDDFIPPGPENEFKGTSRDIRNLNYQSAILDFVNHRK